MNADIEFTEPGWLDRMLARTDMQGRPAAVVGARRGGDIGDADVRGAEGSTRSTSTSTSTCVSGKGSRPVNASNRSTPAE